VQTLALIILAYLAYLIFEQVAHARRLRRIPIRIAVTGTRGKSSVTRLLASILREDGRRVLAKTTGTEPRMLLPDGSETILARRGFPTILEQKGLVKKADRLGVDCLVLEIMSIRPESHFVEAHQLIRPDLLLVTNIRKDHVAAMGATEEDIAAVIGLDLVEGTKVFLPDSARRGAIEAKVLRWNGEMIPVPDSEAADEGERALFPENLGLATAAARHLGVESEAIRRGIANAGADIGRPGIWRLGARVEPALYGASAFAANDPESTLSILSRVCETLPEYRGSVIGLLNLRRDRPDRSEQWIDALRGEAGGRFEQIFLTGGHDMAVQKKLTGAKILKGKTPEAIMEDLLGRLPEKALLFGFGNMGGMGRRLVEYWIRTGDDHGI
jgi:poly-gamma-glutamate synthase PgsB/CapB